MPSATTGPSSRATAAARRRARRTICSAPTMRRSTGSRRTATTSPTSPASTPTGWAPTHLIGHKAFISVGHDEYWSGEQRANVEAARDAGVNLLFWSGNEVYWKTRWETSICDGTPTIARSSATRRPGPTATQTPGPQTTPTSTPQRVDRHLARPALRRFGKRDRRLTAVGSAAGELRSPASCFGPDGTGEFGGALDVPAPSPGLRVWRDTTARRPAASWTSRRASSATSGTRPRRRNTARRPDQALRDDDPLERHPGRPGQPALPRHATHNLSLYRDAESGALVFGAGTVFWSWGAQRRARQLALWRQHREHRRCSSSPSTCSPTWASSPAWPTRSSPRKGLVRAVGIDRHASRHSDARAPARSPCAADRPITGTATDDDGNPAHADDGKVAVSSRTAALPGRSPIAPPTGRYHWRPTAEGTYTIQARAIDDSLNVANITPAPETVTVTAPCNPIL